MKLPEVCLEVSTFVRPWLELSSRHALLILCRLNSQKTMLCPFYTLTISVTSQFRFCSHPGLSRLCTSLHSVELVEAYAAFVPLPTFLLHRGCDTTLESFLLSPFHTGLTNRASDMFPHLHTRSILQKQPLPLFRCCLSTSTKLRLRIIAVPTLTLYCQPCLCRPTSTSGVFPHLRLRLIS